jgi:hypothetical protein
MSLNVYSVFVLSCVQVAALRRADPRPRSPTDCVKDQETEKRPRSNKGMLSHTEISSMVKSSYFEPPQ